MEIQKFIQPLFPFSQQALVAFNNDKLQKVIFVELNYISE
jgi:hypothetical protein